MVVVYCVGVKPNKVSLTTMITVAGEIGDWEGAVQFYRQIGQRPMEVSQDGETKQVCCNDHYHRCVCMNVLSISSLDFNSVLPID